VVNRCKPHVQTPIVSRYPAPAPIHDFILLFLPPCGPHLIPFGHQVHRADPTCLSTPRRPHKAKTFRARSAPAPAQIKPQPAPAILDQESVHTMLSITHHTREQPSICPRTFQSSISPLMSALTWLGENLSIFQEKLPLMSIGPQHNQNEHKQHITHKLHAKSQDLITRSS
jgi:hypothetical protein